MHDRDALRLRLGRRHPARITLRHNGKMLLDGPVDNLSISGAGFYVRPTGEKFPLRGTRYGTCRITLPDRQTVFCQANVVHGKFDAETGYTLLGIEFVGLEAEDERRLQRFIRGVEMASRKLARLDEPGTWSTPAPITKPVKIAAKLPGLKALHASTLSKPLSQLSSRLIALWTAAVKRATRLWTPARPVVPSPAVAGLPPALAALLAAKAITTSTQRPATATNVGTAKTLPPVRRRPETAV